MDLRKIVLSAFKSGKIENKTQKEIITTLHLSPHYKKPLTAVIKKLSDERLIIKSPNGKYCTPERAGVFCATVKANAGGYAFLIPDGYAEREHDYFVPAKHLNGALNKDKVLALPHGKGDEAMVLKVLERGVTKISGIIERRYGDYKLLPDDRAYKGKIVIPPPLLNGAHEGDKVLVEITKQYEGFANAKVLQVLGESGELLTEEAAIIATAELNTEFPDYVIQTAQKVSEQEITLDQRRDLRNLLTLTIDGVDTRDIDDAISLENLPSGVRLGVHIADVSHYVKLSGCIEKEAYERGTSVYFPDRVLPMLPPSLSNGACSLNEGEDRYALTCFMTFNEEGEKVDYEICESVIKSNARLNYDQVTALLDGADNNNLSPQIIDTLKDMASLCLKLEEKRKANGEITLDVKDAHIYVDEQGEIVIPEYERALSHRMIEQFMVSANESVADFAAKRGAPFLYRVHEKPTAEKVNLLYGFAKELGVKISNIPEEPTPKDYQKLLTAVEDMPFAPVVNKVMLRSMQKARYCENNLGHFGLASKCYCHFTSPIRRYPDLFVHRVLKAIMHGESNLLEKYATLAPSAALAASKKERIAESTERSVDDLYKVEYMQKHIGEQFDAVISGVIESGVFAELANTIEGFIPIELLPDDYYVHFPERFLLKGRRHAFKLGDEVKVIVIGCDLCARRIQFSLV